MAEQQIGAFRDRIDAVAEQSHTQSAETVVHEREVDFVHLHEGGMPPGAAWLEIERVLAIELHQFRPTAYAPPAGIFEAVQVQRGSAELDGLKLVGGQMLHRDHIGVEIDLLRIDRTQCSWHDVAIAQIKQGITANSLGFCCNRTCDLETSCTDHGDSVQAADHTPARLGLATSIESSVQWLFVLAQREHVECGEVR